MQFSTILAIGLVCLSCMGLPAMGQSDSATTTEKKDKANVPKRAIRFILLNGSNPVTEKLILPTGKDTTEEIAIGRGMPGKKVMFPKATKTLTLYGDVDKEGKPIEPLFKKDLPTDLGNKVLGLTNKGKSGKIDILFIDEDKIPYGGVMFYNLTNKNFVLNFPNPPAGEKQTLELKAHDTYLFGKTLAEAGVSTSTAATLMDLKKLPNGKEMWMKERGFMITSYKKRKVIFILTPNSNGTTVEMTEIMLFFDGK